MTGRTSILVEYKNADGWHVFTAQSLPGLYVASKNPRRAYDDVATAIQMLLKLDLGIKCEVVPETTLEEIMESASLQRRMPRWPALSNRRFAVDCHA